MSGDSQEPVTIDLSKQRSHSAPALLAEQKRIDRPSIGQQKESAARWVAYVITGTFAAASAFIMLGAFGILIFRPADAKALLIDAAMPFLEKAGIFLSSTFGPLLAFVLGYYFGKSKDGSGTD